jgi:hypothetical protein
MDNGTSRRLVMVEVAEDRHPSTRHLAQFFQSDHLKPPLREISMECSKLADSMIDQLDDSPELTAGLRKLLEATDCFVRAVVDRENVDYRDR